MKIFAKPILRKAKTTMEKVKVIHPAADELINSQEASKQGLFILKSIAASFAGASIPAAIFYFLM